MRNKMNELEKLKEAKDAAWRVYDKLNEPAQEAYAKFTAASDAYKEAVMYEKAKRKVMRDLINAAGDAAH